jgi:hypothetical protein
VPVEAAPFHEQGSAVVIEGQLAAVSAPGGGAVSTYAFADGQWVPEDRLMAPPGSAGGFGTSLAMHAEHLVIGDPTDSTLGIDAGAVHVYERNGGSWAWVQTLTNPTGAASDAFGTAVTMTGTWIVAGAPGDDMVGRVHLFRTMPGSWDWWSSIKQFGTGAVPEAFGSAVTMRDQWLLVGDPLDDAVGLDAGAIYLYEVYDPFSLYQDMHAPASLQPGDGFGGSMDFDGSRLVIGACGDDELGADAGAAYVLAFDAEADHELNLLQRITSDGGGAGDRFGVRVAIDGERFVVGAPGKESMALPGGRASVFHREAGVMVETWSLEVEVSPGDGVPGDLFGTAVGLAGQHALVGAPAADPAGDASGAAYLVSLSSQSLPGGECPCDVLAMAKSFGTGKPGTAGVPHLAFDHPPVVGESVSMKLSNALPGATPFLFWGPASTAVPFDGGQLYVSGFHLLALQGVDSSGGVDTVLAVPADPALCGLQISFQAMFVDPGATGAFQTAQSNGVEVVLGY